MPITPSEDSGTAGDTSDGGLVENGDVTVTPGQAGAVPAKFGSGDSPFIQAWEFNAAAATEEAVKGAVIAGLAAVPGAGPVLALGASVLMAGLWPDGKDTVWETIREAVEKVVDRKLGDFYGKLMTNELAGIRVLVQQYCEHAKSALHSGVSQETARSSWRAAVDKIVSSMPAFRDKDYKYDVLPVFVQAANLHLVLLHDKIRNGRSIGFTDGDIQDARDELAKHFGMKHSPFIGGGYDHYVEATYHDGIKRLRDNKFQSYAYMRLMHLAADEYRDIWAQSLDPDHPRKEFERSDVEIFLGPFGDASGYWFDKWDASRKKRPLDVGGQQHMYAMNIWADGYTVNAVQTRHGWNWGEVEGVVNSSLKSSNDSSDDEDIQGGRYGGGDPVEYPWAHDPTKGDYFRTVWVYARAGDDYKAEINGFQFQCFTVGKSHLCGRKCSYDNQNVEGFAIEGWRVSNLHMLKNKAGSGFGQCLAIGFRPVHNSWKPKDVKLPPHDGKTFHFLEANSGQLLDLSRYSESPITPVVLAGTAGTRSQEWTLHSNPDGTWRIVNAYNGLALTGTSGSAAQGETSVTLCDEESSGAWTFEDNDDGTWGLTAPDSRRVATHDSALTLVDAAVDDVEPAVPSRWILVPSTSSGPGDGESGPVLHTGPVSRDNGITTTRMMLANPSSSSTFPNWRLTFHLPPETAGITVTAENARLESAVTTGRGVLVTITPADGQTTLDASQSIPFTLTATGANPLLADTRLNDIRISS
ncbi:RICIN domain-containing protein [Streptomyces sp. SCA3-4]|uniref:insecticidal delta-endotoxin Cry8Ea1 family protein n=1 Tax=Streptomyces sichuanensis TaxID=2871810 RepID=UPI001CE30EE5|nr:insecticidal delta-endotoxin Cry8Ea1 family protein [Streptomyces sichuanensis]MCA6091827.1 RICIN domain-containing protein [Streptomyces sichuanensis]